MVDEDTSPGEEVDLSNVFEEEVDDETEDDSDEPAEDEETLPATVSDKRRELGVEDIDGIDETVGWIHEMLDDVVKQVAEDHQSFDPDDDFKIAHTYVYGSVPAGNAREGDSDLNVALSVPVWDYPDEADSRSSYRRVCEDIMRRLRDEPLFGPGIEEGVLDGVYVWIGEPEYNAIMLREQPAPKNSAYFPEAGEVVDAERAAEVVASAYDHHGDDSGDDIEQIES